MTVTDSEFPVNITIIIITKPPPAAPCLLPAPAKTVYVTGISSSLNSLRNVSEQGNVSVSALSNDDMELISIMTELYELVTALLILNVKNV